MKNEWEAVKENTNYALDKDRIVNIWFDYVDCIGIVYTDKTNQKDLGRKQIDFDAGDFTLKNVNKEIQDFAKENNIDLPEMNEENLSTAIN